MAPKSKHTPEPWTDGDGLTVLGGPDAHHQIVIAEVYVPGDKAIIKAAPKALTLLRRILGMHETNNCGAYNGEAVLSESVADEIRDLLAEAN